MPARVANMSMSTDDRFERLLKILAIIKSRGSMDIAEFQRMITEKIEAREIDVNDVMNLLAWIDFEGERVIIAKDADKKLEKLMKLANSR